MDQTVLGGVPGGSSGFPLHSPEGEDPIRSEILSAERLEQAAEALAGVFAVTGDPRRGRRLTPRLRENGRVLLESYRAIADAIRDERAIVPAAEWLVDNFHIVEDQLREIREDLPIGYYRELPKLAGGPFAGHPRVFALAWAFVAHTDSRIEPDTLIRFVRSYQRVQPLTIGELWAIPITLRAVLVENLRRLASRVVVERALRERADRHADVLLGLIAEGAEPPARREELHDEPFSTSFAVRLIQRLRDPDVDSSPAHRWLDRVLEKEGRSHEEIVRSEHQAQAATNVTVRNVITSMRLLSGSDWKSIFEELSLVDHFLRDSTDFGRLDFTTRDAIRHVVENVARRTRRPELEVARAAVRLAARAAPPESGRNGSGRKESARAASDAAARDERESYYGYYLLAEGRADLERALGGRTATFSALTSRRGVRLALYLGGLAALSGFLLALPVLGDLRAGASPADLLILALFAAIPFSDAAMALLNRVAIGFVGPGRLPKLEIGAAVPDSMRTLVAIPTLLSSEEGILALAEQLEVHYLANPEAGLSFALVTDWSDAPSEETPADGPLLAAAAGAIARLNARYGASPAGEPRFLLLHRRRVWNPRDGCWMGWERKRGKLQELNRLLRGAKETTFLPPDGERPWRPPAGVRYVITLDADTRLPRGEACRLIGTIAHPLNRARFDERRGAVTQGYGVLQPRVTPCLPSTGQDTLFRRMTSGPAGIDPYASAVSDVYQDLFGEGSFAGKGIYEIDAFDAALAGRVPENALLSHDLFEGAFARAGFVTDVECFEEFPSSYEAAAARHHRWMRGDWQLLPWILGWARGPRGIRPRTRIRLLDRWKMVDNLRRSLSAPALLAAFLAAWLLPSVSSWAWTRFLVAAFCVPHVLSVLDATLPRRPGFSKRNHAIAVARDAAAALGRAAAGLSLLVHQACLSVDAIARTLVRLVVTRRRLLEWTTAAEVGARFVSDPRRAAAQMALPVLIALSAGAAVAAAKPAAFLVALPLVLAWTAAPWVVHLVSRPLPNRTSETAKSAEADYLRGVARRTWRYFEELAGEEDHCLPPDNIQLTPVSTIAHRTSPTNIALHLLSCAAAYDFGWEGASAALDRIEATFATISRLERLKGHLFNWYDSRTLVPLEPRYISTVDSGNLAGHLLALGAACREMAQTPPDGRGAATGIEDAARLLLEDIESPDAVPPGGGERLARVRGAVQSLLRSASALRDPADPPARRLADLAKAAAGVTADVASLLAEAPSSRALAGAAAWSRAIERCVASHARDAEQDPGSDGEPAPFSARALAAAQAAEAFAAEMDFGFLYDAPRKLFAIGFRVADRSLDSSHYDLLASEARLASFIAIAKGDVPTEHWFALGRLMTPVEHGAALLSWSGSMFEYLMPSLVMASPAGSLIAHTNALIVRRQIRYCAERGVPWGISESAFNARDASLAYQYSNFGVPGLGLKRGLSENLVVSPYATALGALYAPGEAARNFARLEKSGALGDYGFFEAIDYTPARLREGRRFEIVRAHMAHHQGMTIVAIDNVVHAGVMRNRFHEIPSIQAAALLLQERTPRDVAVARPRAETIREGRRVQEILPPAVRRFTNVQDPTPRTHLLSNGRYSVMVTSAGSGTSRWQGLAVTRWREDATRDPWGSFVYVRDAESGNVWSAGFQPTAVPPKAYEAVFAEDRIELRRRDGRLATTTEILVSPEDDAEVRRVSVTNRSGRTRDVELTSYAEIVLAAEAADEAHPAFSKLFVETEYAPDSGTIVATRRPRSPEDAPIWAAHVVAVDAGARAEIQHETDRARFLGRGRSTRSPAAVFDGRPLSGTVGPVLDPVFSLRVRLRIPPGGTARATFSTLVAPTRAQVAALAERYRDPTTFERVETLAWTHAQVLLNHLGITADEAQMFQRLANRLLYSDSALRPPDEVLRKRPSGRNSLWAHGISGDRPIVALSIESTDELGLVRELLRAQEYWRTKGLTADVVILNERPPSYAQDLAAALENLIRQTRPAAKPDDPDPPGGIFVLRADILPAADRRAVLAAARAVIVGRGGTLAEQILRARRAQDRGPQRAGGEVGQPAAAAPAPPGETLEFANGLGGFAREGREYVITLGPGRWTPAPWINVVSNTRFGFHVSESGSGYTWAHNSRENKLTPWSNDPVEDPAGEAIYVRDEESGEVWTPTALPIREKSGAYVCRHGQGYTRFLREAHGIALDLVEFVPAEDPVKVARLVIENRSGKPRRLSVTAYVEWVLGVSRGASAPHLVVEFDPESGALLARNPWSLEFSDKVAFLETGGPPSSWTADRTEFLGRHGSLEAPAALAARTPLSGRVGAGLDPCGALQRRLVLPAGGRATIDVLLGQASSSDEARQIIARQRAAGSEKALEEVTRRWDELLGAIRIRTPDRALDLMVNRWLLYQTVSCRLWARSAFYQAGGAYGYRDQLQDVLALLMVRPDSAREQIVLAASRQFLEGDVQHWWHPPSGRGVRTRCSDDRLWLPYALAQYVESTGDRGILDEEVPFLEGPLLPIDRDESYFEPTTSAARGTLFEHAARALDRSLEAGAHGLPLIGSGDWNDGMNRVGRGGSGESVWLGWFLHAALTGLIPIAEARGEEARAAAWRERVAELGADLESAGWDGDWYRRAYFDDGTALGSASNQECRIDSIAQSWSVISGAGLAEHRERAMAAVLEHLVRREDRLVLLFTPPFREGALDPGYVRGYLPGVRENGGQYTHAALWAAIALVQQGQGAAAAELLAMLNPIHAARTPAGVHRYMVEPYVVAADVYSEPPHVGRGGWTWYTGSAAWMYRAAIESTLGVRKHGAALVVDPCIPPAWGSCEIAYRFGGATYRIAIENPEGRSRGVASIELDGRRLSGGRPGGAPPLVPLVDDGAVHAVRVRLG